MASFLFIFPHPDDESFGPAPVIARQRRQGHEVHLLTLTRGEATTQRERLGYSKAEMGEARHAEMQNVAQALDLTDLTVLDFPDGGLAELDPRVLEGVVEEHLRAVRPDVVVTYAVHGVSGHPDHLVTHAIVKRTYCALRAEKTDAPGRLALFTLPEDGAPDRPEHLRSSPPAAIDSIVPFAEEDLARARDALDCYVTYQAVIEKHEPLKSVADGVCFELFQEEHAPPLDNLLVGLDS